MHTLSYCELSNPELAKNPELAVTVTVLCAMAFNDAVTTPCSHLVHVRHDVSTMGSALRASPRENSDYVRDQQNNLRFLMPYEVFPSDTVDDDYDNDQFLKLVVPVREGVLSGYVWRKHLVYKDDTGHTYKHLSTADYWSQPWCVSRGNCNIVCTHSTREVDPDSIGERPDDCKKIFADGYTYIKLEVGRLWHFGRRVEALRSYHFTLSYAAPMTDLDREALSWRLTNILNSWWTTKPLLRPQRLLHCRMCRVREDPNSYLFTTKVLKDLSKDEVCRLYRQGCLEPMVHFQGRRRRTVVELDEQDWLRLYNRDVKRHADAVARAHRLLLDPDQNDLQSGDHCATGPFELFVKTPRAGLGGPKESEPMHDLLAYLCEEIWHFASAHFIVEKRGKEKAIPPYVTGPESLHLSKQSHWQLCL
jgi:hypothetical protein